MVSIMRPPARRVFRVLTMVGLAAFLAAAAWEPALGGEPVVVKAGFHHSPPFMMRDTETGVYHDVLRAMERVSDLSFDIRYYPHARVKKKFNVNEIDIQPAISPGWTAELPIPGVFSIPFIKHTDIVLFRPGKRIPVKQPEDLRGKKLGTIRGYWYPGFMELFDRGEIVRVDGNDEEHVMQLMERGRIDQMIVEKTIAAYRIKQNEAFRDLEFGDIVGQVELAVRVHPNRSRVVPLLNEAIRRLQNSGEIEGIVDRYR